MTMMVAGTGIGATSQKFTVAKMIRLASGESGVLFKT